MCVLPTVVEDTWVIYGLRLVDDFEYRYVGLTTVGPTLRLKRHFYDAKKSPNRHVCKWLNKHSSQITIDVLEVCPDGDTKYLWEAEQFWISQIKGFGHSLTNASLGGESGSFGARWTLPPEKIRRGEKHPNFGRTHSQGTKDLISSKKTGIVRSEESRRKQGDSIRGENHWAYGQPKSEDHRKKISDSLKGRPVPEDRKQKISKSRLGKPLTDEHRANISKAITGSNHHNFGKPAFNRGKPSQSAHTRWHTNKNISKPETCSYCKETIDKGSN